MEIKINGLVQNIKKDAGEIIKNSKEAHEKKKAEKAERADIIKEEKDFLLVQVVEKAVQLPEVKVNRNDFLSKCFKECNEEKLKEIIEVGPVEAGYTEAELRKKAAQLIGKRTSFSAVASFAAGIPGGIAMALTIPVDMLQFYGVALRLAQELAYLYGEEDIFKDDGVAEIDDERVKNQLILYIGAMMGSTGAIKSVQLLSSQLAKVALKKLPQKALTKTFYYPIIKSICKAFGVAVTKESFAKGVSKVIPIAGGVVSGGITLASMIPMANRLQKALNKAKFEYTAEDFEADWKEVNEANEKAEAEEQNSSEECDQLTEEIEREFIEADENDELLVDETNVERETEQADNNFNDTIAKIQKAKEMLDAGVITDEEFAALKAKIIGM